jgi:transposase
LHAVAFQSSHANDGRILDLLGPDREGNGERLVVAQAPRRRLLRICDERLGILVGLGAYLRWRRILVVGAHSVLRRAKQNPEKYPWLTQLLARRPFKVVAIALANKMARISWALSASGERYRAPRLAAA